MPVGEICLDVERRLYNIMEVNNNTIIFEIIDYKRTTCKYDFCILKEAACSAQFNIIIKFFVLSYGFLTVDTYGIIVLRLP